MPDIFINTVWYIVLTAFTASGETLHSNWSIPFENPNICGYYLKNMDVNPDNLPFYTLSLHDALPISSVVII